MRITRIRTDRIAPDAQDRAAVRPAGTATIRIQQEVLMILPEATAQDTALETTAHRAEGVDTQTPLAAVHTLRQPVTFRAECPAKSLVQRRARLQAPYQVVFHRATPQVA